MSSLKIRLTNKITGLLKDFGKIGFWAAFSAVMPIIGLSIFLGTIYNISPWLEANPKIGIPTFIFTISIMSGLAILPTNIVGMTSGWAFGFPLGLLTMLCAIFGAVTLNFFIARRLASKDFKQTLSEKPKLKAIHNALLEGSSLKVIAIIILLRLSPATPFAATNFLISASGVSIKSYVVGTVIAYIPRTAATVFVGSSLSKLDFDQPTENWKIIFLVVTTIITMIIIAVLSKRALNRLTEEQKGQ